MTKEIHITNNGTDDVANLLIDGDNVACITGDVTLAVDCKTYTTCAVFARVDGEIVGQYHNVDETYTIVDNRHLAKLQL